MKDKWNFRGRFGNSDLMHYLRFAAAPLAAVILIAVIMSVDKGTDDGAAAGDTAVMENETENGGNENFRNGLDGANQPDGAAAEGENRDAAAGEEAGGAEVGEEAGNAENGEADGGAAAEGEDRGAAAGEEAGDAETAAGPAYADIDISGYMLKQDEVPELLALVRTYCQAKEDCDPELLARLFGKSGLTEEELAAERERMELVKASVKRYENISCYSIEGPEPDSYVIFPYFEICYREAETLMPQLTWGYVTKLDDGSFVMNEEISEDVAAYIARIGEKEDVAAVRAQVAQAQASAIASDEKLKSIYSGESEVVIGS